MASDIKVDPPITTIERKLTPASIDQDEFHDLTLFQALKRWRRTTLYCLGMSATILMYGYDYVIVGTSSAMPSFQQDYGILYGGRWILPSLWLALWTVAGPLAAMLGSVFAGFFQDWYGRRWSLALASFVSAVSVGILFASGYSSDIHVRRGVFLAGKGLQGFAIGMAMTTTQTYMSEILPPKIRGPILAFFPTFTLLGQLVGASVIFACLNVKNGYFIAFATQWVFSCGPFIMAFVAPESPAYLVRKDREAEALKAQKRLDSPSMDSQQTIDRIRKNIEHERQEARPTYRDCFKGNNLRRSLIIVFASSLPQLFGLALLAKASYFGQIVGMEANLSVMVLILGIVFGFLANLASIWLLSRVGRRKLTVISLGCLTLLWTAMGISGFWKGGSATWFAAVDLVFVVVAAGLGVWPCSFAVASETSALHLRAKSQGINGFTAGATSALFGFVLPYIFNTDQGNLGAKTGFVYAGLCLISCVIAFFYMPEMKGRTMSEIDYMFDLKLPARQFRRWLPPQSGHGEDHSPAG